MTGFLRKHIPKYSEIARPLVDLTRKNATFNWSAEKENSFQTLKAALQSDTTLKLFDVNEPSFLFTDASQNFLGGILMQKNESGDFKPVYYISHPFNATQKRYSTIERELFAIYFCLKRLKSMLYCPMYPIICYSDHKPLSAITPNTANDKMQRWLLEIENFNVRICYLKGSQNYCADFLSRHALPQGINLINSNRVSEKSIVE